jgi:hypothetical protein
MVSPVPTDQLEIAEAATDLLAAGAMDIDELG